METTEITLQNQDQGPAALIRLAIENNLDIDKLERLMELKERHDRHNAEKAFYQALSNFQAELPKFEKKSAVGYEAKNGGTKVSYKFASLDYIIETIKPICQKHGFSYRFENSQKDGLIYITCIIAHSEGHKEKTSMSAAADGSGNKNAIQSNGSTFSYLKRYTLMGALGIATGDEDNDGKTSQKKTVDQNKVEVENAKKVYLKKLEEVKIGPFTVPEKFELKNWKVKESERTATNYLQAVMGLDKWEKNEIAKLETEDNNDGK
jgi:hypothetical protein